MEFLKSWFENGRRNKDQKLRWIFGVLAIGVLATAFNNCSKVGFSSEPPSVDSLGKPTDPSGPTVPEIITNCNNAMARGALQTSAQTLRFEDTKQETGRSTVCQFGTGDNLSEQDGSLRARYEQSQALSLPANAVICDVQMQTNLQSFKYDDVFLLTFNDRILATNDKTALNQRLTPESQLTVASKQVPLYKYDWLALRTAPFANVVDDYCLGKDQGLSTCSWPVTEQAGQIKFSFTPELLINLGAKASAANQKFGFVITGDNDDSLDCYHERLEFSLSVKYYLR
jgi:hypothetical protein